MDRRAVLRILSFGVAGSSGCLTARPAGSETTATEPTRTTETTPSETRPTATETTRRETRTTPESRTTKSTSDACPASAVPADRIRRRSDYALGIVRKATDEPAVAVVGEEWRSTLETDAMSESDEAFVTDTDFEQFVVLVVQYETGSGGHSLRVTAADIRGDTVDAELCVAGPGAPNDAPTENLFVRLPYSGTPPSKAELRIETRTGSVTVSDG